jgi:hypothetical protein
MLRIVCCVCVVVLLVSCNKNYRRLHIEKRVYRDGYYVHVPWERRTPVNEYPKPQPYPVDHSRTAKTDTTRKYAGGVTADSSNTARNSGSSSTNGSSSGGSGGYGAPPPNGNGGYGYGTPSGPAPGQQPANGTNGNMPQPSPPVATYQPSPPLQQQSDPGHPPLQKPNTAPPVTPADPLLPPDSTVAKNDSVSPPEDPKPGRDFNFPEGEFSLVAELGFCNPVYTDGIEIKAGSYNAGGAARYTIHPWSRHKLSLEAGLFISQHFIAQDHHKYYPMFMERYDHERIMQWKTRFMLMDHLYVLRSPVAEMDAIELGLFSDISFMSTHVAIDNIGNTKEASFTRNKSRLFGLHYLHNAQFGMTARVANDVWSVFANYRLTQLVKGNPDGGDLPELVVGATFAFGE